MYVSRSYYYQWKGCSKGIWLQENERLIEKIRKAHTLSRRNFGSSRVAKGKTNELGLVMKKVEKNKKRPEKKTAFLLIE